MTSTYPDVRNEFKYRAKGVSRGSCFCIWWTA